MKKTIVLSRINYALYNRLNNNNLPYDNSKMDLTFSMYIGYNNILEFPKGVREKNETPLNCALREFSEETGFNLDLNLINVIDQITYKYISGNNKWYKCIYYVIDIPLPFANDSTQILKLHNLPVLSDNFNILLCTNWFKIRNSFLKRQLNELVIKLDNIFI